MNLNKPQVLIPLGMTLFVPVTIFFVLLERSDINYEDIIKMKVKDLEARLGSAESINKHRTEQLERLSQMLRNYLSNDSKGFNFSSPLHNNMSLFGPFLSGTNVANGFPESGISRYLPHLAQNPFAFQPSVKVSEGRHNVELVIGIPTVKRDKQDYLVSTLESINSALSDAEKAKTLLVIQVSEPHDRPFVLRRADDLRSHFPEEFSSGFFEVISPSASYYPELNTIKPTLGDSLERTKWRAKQVLDFAYMMIYCRTRGQYFLQLEDDIQAKPGFVSSVLSYAAARPLPDHNWTYLSFSALGFIGKLFRSEELYSFVDFCLMYYKHKPVDWLLDLYVGNKVCNPDKPVKDCNSAKAKIAIHFKPSLFQHVGKYSSLQGKVQKLKDKYFGKAEPAKDDGGPMPATVGAPKNWPGNPSADVSTTLKQYQLYSIAKAYSGESVFWGLTPQPGDSVTFTFHPSIKLKSILIRSGASNHLGDVLSNTTLDIMPVRGSFFQEKHVSIGANDGVGDVGVLKWRQTADEFVEVAAFSESGVVNVNIDKEAPDILAVRLTVHSELTSWVILSQIMLQTYDSAS